MEAAFFDFLGKYYIPCASPANYQIILPHFLFFYSLYWYFLTFVSKLTKIYDERKMVTIFWETDLCSRLSYLTEVCVEISKLTSIGKRYTQYYPAPENPQGFLNQDPQPRHYLYFEQDNYLLCVCVGGACMHYRMINSFFFASTH